MCKTAPSHTDLATRDDRLEDHAAPPPLDLDSVKDDIVSVRDGLPTMSKKERNALDLKSNSKAVAKALQKLRNECRGPDQAKPVPKQADDLTRPEIAEVKVASNELEVAHGLTLRLKGIVLL